MTVEISQKLCGFSMGIIHNNSMHKKKKKKSAIISNTHLSLFVVQLISHVHLCNPMKCSMPGFPVLHYLLGFAQTHVHWVSDTIQPSHPLSPPSLLPSIFPSITVFTNELVLHIRWAKYWSFRLSINPSNEYSGLVFFRIDWLDLLAVQGTLKSLLYTTVQSINSLVLSLLYGPTLTSVHDCTHLYNNMEKPRCCCSVIHPSALNLYQQQGLFQWVSWSHQMTKILEFQLQHQSFQWVFRVDFL